MSNICYILTAIALAGCGGQVSPSPDEARLAGAAAGSGTMPAKVIVVVPPAVVPTAPQVQYCRGRDCGAGECILGSCVLDAQNCNRSSAACTEQAPPCPPGSTASVLNGCWGECVRIEACGRLEGCEVCRGNGLACVKWHGESQSAFRCRDLPKSCPSFDCRCLGHLCGGRSCVEVVDDSGMLLISCGGIAD